MMLPKGNKEKTKQGKDEMYEKNDKKKAHAGRRAVGSTHCDSTAAGIADHTTKGSKSGIGNPAKSTYRKRGQYESRAESHLGLYLVWQLSAA